MPKLAVDGVGTFDVPNGKRLVNALEDNDDVQNVYSNMDVDESVLESIG